MPTELSKQISESAKGRGWRSISFLAPFIQHTETKFNINNKKKKQLLSWGCFQQRYSEELKVLVA